MRHKGRARSLMLAAWLLALPAASGCAVPGLRRAAPGEAATVAAANAASWAATLLAAQRELERGRHAEADRTLREFAERAPSSPEAVETMYWRALIILDPASRGTTSREATALLEKYLASDAPITHRAEAAVLQRIAASMASAAARPTTSDAEVKALKEELEQTKAELERIRKRLAAPPPVTPPPGVRSPDPE